MKNNKKNRNLSAFRFTKLIPSAHIDGDGSTTSVLWLLCAMADNNYSTCNPSALYIARKTGLSVSTVRRCIGRLVDLGLIKKQVRGTSSNHEANIYTLDYDKLTTLQTDCDKADKEHMDAVREQETTSRSSRRERAGSNDCPGHGDTDKVAVVRVISSGCPGQMETLSGSNGGVCPGHGDTLTAVTTKTTTKELDADASGSSDSGETLDMIHDQPANRESKIKHARESLGTWEYELQKARQNGSPHLSIYQARVAASQRCLDGLLSESL